MNQSELMSMNIAKNSICRQRLCSGSSCGGCSDGTSTTSGTGATGTQGPLGSTGSIGATGPVGATGPFGGPRGDTGAQGLQGIMGVTGPSQGPIGATGAQGVQGPSQGPPGQNGDTGSQGAQGLQGIPGSISSGNLFIIKAAAGNINGFNFRDAIATSSSTFGVYYGGVSIDATTFNIRLNAVYSYQNLPVYTMTAYVYSTSAGYINCQRQLGTHTGTAAAQVTMDTGVTAITFNYMNKTNFPYTSNDGAGYALYIYLHILN